MNSSTARLDRGRDRAHALAVRCGWSGLGGWFPGLNGVREPLDFGSESGVALDGSAVAGSMMLCATTEGGGDSGPGRERPSPQQRGRE